MTSESTTKHRVLASQYPAARVAIITVSDTRSIKTDESGSIIEALVSAAGHTIQARLVLPDDPILITEQIRAFLEKDEVDAILLNGGTGISPRDGTYEAISGLLQKVLPGFGEIFRMLSWQDVGPATILSRAIAGINGRTLIVSMPGSTNAVRLAMEKLIVPELAHMIWELKHK